MKKFIFLAPIIILLAAGCGPLKTQPIKTSPTQNEAIKQGLTGNVSLATGNCMPTIGTSKSSCSIKKLSTKIYIREPATGKNMDYSYLKNPTKLIQTVTSSDTGNYQAAVPAGTYSVFADDNGKEYCNLSDGQGNMCRVTVGPGITEYNIKIDHAVY